MSRPKDQNKPTQSAPPTYMPMMADEVIARNSEAKHSHSPLRGNGKPEVATNRETVISVPGGESLEAAAEDGRVSVRSKDISVKILEAIAKKVSPEEVADKLAECLSASKTIVVGGAPFEVDDHATRLAALKLLMQYQVGNPVSRSEVVNHNIDTMTTLEEKLRKSPALRRAVGKMIDRTGAIDIGGEIVDEADGGDDYDEMERVLQEAPVLPETDIQREYRTRTVKGTDIGDKYST